MSFAKLNVNNDTLNVFANIKAFVQNEKSFNKYFFIKS